MTMTRDELFVQVDNSTDEELLHWHAAEADREYRQLLADEYSARIASADEAVQQAWYARQARVDATHDHAAQCERTVAPGVCTGCERPSAELLPWTPAERLCHRCVSFQLDLLAKAIAEGDGHTVNVMKVRWV